MGDQRLAAIERPGYMMGEYEDMSSLYPDDQQQNDGKREPLEWLSSIVGHRNVAELLEQDELSRIGALVVQEYEVDLASRADWERTVEAAMKIAKQVHENKSFPWPNAANVKYPLLTSAAIQFAARAYPEIVPGSDIVKAKVVGEDPDGSKQDRADRISKHMSWQLTEEMVEWEEDMDRLLTMLPVVGLLFKKTYYDPTKRRNVSELVTHENCVVNYNIKHLDTARRVSHVFEAYQNDIYENVASGIWLDVEVGLPTDAEPNDEDAPHTFIEQHRFLDLDEDGYAEPYIVTVHKETHEVVRIVPRFEPESVEIAGNKILRIVPTQYFTAFQFLPNPDGGFYSLGFGQLVNPINETVNTVINQLLDAGTLANAGGGFLARGVRLTKSGSGVVRLSPGEWKPVDTTAADLRAGIFPTPVTPPSPVLFQLLGTLIDAAKEITAVSDVMLGQETGANTPATTTLALVEQGQKVFSAIYKRIYRALKAEYSKLYGLNRIFLDEEKAFRVLDVQSFVGRQDYAKDDFDIVPVSEPGASSDVQRLAKAQALLSISGRPGLDEGAVTKRALQAMKIDNPDEIMPPPDPNAQPPIDMMLQVERMRVEIDQIKSQILLNIAKAEAAEAGPQLAQYQAYAQQLSGIAQQQSKIIEQATGAPAPGLPPEPGVIPNAEGMESGGMAGMGGSPDIAGSPVTDQGAPVPVGAGGNFGGGPEGV